MSLLPGLAISPSWDQCGHNDCIGIVLGEDGMCLNHTNDRAKRHDAFSALVDGAVNFTAGLSVSADLLVEILSRCPRANGGPQLSRADFTRATFGERASFHGATFGESTSFHGATFGESTSFHGATFGESTSFRDATFGEGTNFSGANFGHSAFFTKAIFGKHAYFHEATFGEQAFFGEATFGEQAFFGKATFGEGAYFAKATFGDGAIFGPLFTLGRLTLSETEFTHPRTIDISAGYIDARRLSLPDGATLRVRWAEIDLEECDFREPTMLVQLPYPANETEDEGLNVLAAWSPSHPDTRPRVVSLRRANVSGLVLTDVDLSACRFAGAHNLDRVKLEGTTAFSRAPSFSSSIGGRQALAEEHEWRRNQTSRAGWCPRTCQSDLLGHDEPLSPRHITTLYRALRKSREDTKDEPGAADFYYGEMEMRRRATPLRSAEGFLLWMYWLTSGYGLRASRALLSLLVTIGVFAVFLWWFGFQPQQEPARALLFSAESTSSLFRVPETEGFSLTYWGEVLQMALRLVGPLFFGLTLLSLRGRVKR